MKKKTRQVKARRLYTDGLPTKPYPCRMLYAKQDGNTPMSVFVLPATPEAWDAMVEQGAKAMFITETEPGKKPASYAKATQYMKEYYRALSRAFLTALSLVRPTQKEGT